MIGGTVAAILALMIFAPFWADAQEGSVEEQNQTEAVELRGNARALEGSWSIQVTRRDCQTGAAIATFPTMTTFARGGTLQDYGVAMAPAGCGPGHGVWSHEGGRRFSAALQFFLFGADGSYAGKQIVRRQIELSRFGSGYTATGAVQVFKPGGTQINMICTAETGTRFE